MFSAAIKSGAAGSPKDPQFNYVTMLLHGDGTNGAQNNTFLDSSTNNFTITRNGNTTQGTFTPYGSNWSNYFDGANTALNQNSSTNWKYLHNGSTWTIEFDIFPQTTSLVVLASTVKQLSNIGFTLQLNSVVANDVAFYFFNGSSYAQFSSTGNIVANQWNHVGITFDGSTKTCTFYINGVQRGSSSNTGFSYSASNSTYGLNIGCEASSYLYDFTGYLSNLRISTVVRSGMTTVPTTPYTNDANTSLLTCQSNRFVDNSSNAYTLDINGSPSVQRFSPFSPTTAYSTSVIGGSGYFDGSGDSLGLPNSTSLAMSTGNFTIEFWINTSNAAQSGWVITTDTVTTANSLYISFSGSTIRLTNNATVFAVTPTLVSNAWYHIAVVRSGTSSVIYTNGVAGTAVTCTVDFTQNTSLVGANNFIGYLTDFRIVKGSAVYTSNFTPPTAPLTAITNTSLLLSYTNAGILDNAMMNDLETVGNAQISTSVKKYGTGSMYFDGTGDYLLLQGGQNFTYGTGDFTIEMWIYVVSGLNADIVYYDGRPTSTNGLYNIIYTNSTGKLVYNTNSADRITGTTTLSTGTWYHIALSRSGTSTKLFLNGTQEGSTYTDSNSYIVGTNRPVIGGNGYTLGNAPLNGYIDDLRITKGYARYTATFTPPTAAFPNN